MPAKQFAAGKNKNIKKRGAQVYTTGKDIVQDVVQNKNMGGMMESRKKGMGLKMANGGSALKPIPADNKGLPNLPQDVRNKMGFMQKGGAVMVQSRGCGAMMQGKRKKTKVPS